MKEGSRRVGVGIRIDIDNNKKRYIRKSGIGIKIIGGARFSSIAGKKGIKLPTVENCPECIGYYRAN
jgi:hypothetical protein